MTTSLRCAGTVLALMICTLAISAPARAGGPFGDGTVFIDQDIITPADPSALASIGKQTRGYRTIFDWRYGKDGRDVKRKVWQATIRYTDGQVVKGRVNPEFSAATAKSQTRKFAKIIGQLPHALRAGIKTITINRGDHAPAASEDGDVTISTDGVPEYQRDGDLEEALAHEATHATLDKTVLHSAAWKAAQKADPTFISDYAEQYPDQEDLAESVVPWLIVRYRQDRVDQGVIDTINRSIPNRLAVLDALGLDMRPWVKR